MGQGSTGFGSSLAIYDGTIFVGKAQTRDAPGEVYVYRYDEDSGMWVEQQRLRASDATDERDDFGGTMVAGDGMLFVGATGSGNSSGAVYLFTSQEDGSWVETARLTASDAAEDHRFGNAMALRGHRLLVSSTDTTSTGGSVYVFEHDSESSTWNERLKWQGGRVDPMFTTALGQNNVFPLVGFGQSLALDDHTAFISSLATGSVNIYNHDPETDSWSEGSALPNIEDKGSATLVGSFFGYSMVLDGDQLLISAPGYGGLKGAILVYEKDESSEGWRSAGLLSGFPEESDRTGMLGTSMYLGGGYLWAGAPTSRPDGTMIRFQKNEESGEWEPVGTEIHPGDDQYCEVVSVENQILVCGIPEADRGLGKAVVYEIDGAEWSGGQDLINEVESIPSALGEETLCEEGVAGPFDCSNVDMLSFLSVSDLGGARGINVNDLWGWTDPETGKEWALIGRIDGTSFVDVSDPYNPVYVGNLPKTEGSRTAVWRDIKVYMDHAFIVADGAGDHGMQVFDLHKLRDLENIPVMFEFDALYEGIASAHNIVINEGTGFAYSVGSRMGGETCGGGLHMIDIRNPLEPVFAGCFADTETGRRSTGYTHDAQCVVYSGPDTEHHGKEICFGANETALSISDVTDKDQTVKLSNATYPNYRLLSSGMVNGGPKVLLYE